MIPPWLDPGHAREQYEVLRREAVETTATGRRGHGLAVFLTRGMAAWLRALAALAPQRIDPVPLQREVIPSDHVPVLPTYARSEWTAVLADMVLACSQKGA